MICGDVMNYENVNNVETEIKWNRTVRVVDRFIITRISGIFSREVVFIGPIFVSFAPDFLLLGR